MFASLHFLFLLFVSCYGFDPDFDICDKPVLTAAVNADDGNSYIFKGKYFWQTNTLNNDSGIIGFAKSSSEEWSDLKDDIKACFTVRDGRGKLRTVFIVKDKWFAYEKGVKRLDGSTLNWPNFQNLKITTSFPLDHGSDSVFILHDHNINYTLYNFTNLSKPKIVSSGRAVVRDHFVFFLDFNTNQTISSRESETEIKNLIDVKAGLAYPKQLVLISKDKYCVVDLSAQPYEKMCDPKPEKTTKKLLKCPLDLSKRSTTAAPILTSDLNAGRTNLRDTSTGSDSPQTSHRPVNGKTISSDGGELSTRIDINNENPTFWTIFFVVTIISIALVSVSTIAVVSKTRNKRPRGTVVYQK